MKSLPIAVVERESGISKDALRVWERRYGFPIPSRDEHGDRSYAPEQVEKLKLIKQLLDRGNRPAKVIPLSTEDLTALLRDSSAVLEGQDGGMTSQVLELLRAANDNEVVALLTRKLVADGLMEFVVAHLAPMNDAVGQAWAQGRISVAQEHLYTEIVQKILRAYLLNLRGGARGGPRVLLATLPGEQHGLGLLMVECVLATAGAVPVSLGTEVPLNEIATAAESHQCDVVALSFSRARTRSFVTQGVKAMRAQLPAARELWIGGEGAGWVGESIAGVVHLSDLRSVQQRLVSRTPPG